MNRNTSNDGRMLVNANSEWPGNKAKILISLSVLDIFTWLLTTTFTVRVHMFRENPWHANQSHFN